jgi:hypothetical protein
LPDVAHERSIVRLFAFERDKRSVTDGACSFP